MKISMEKKSKFIPEINGSPLFISKIIILSCVLLLVAGLLFINKPNTVKGSFVLFSQNKPQLLISQSTGSVSYFVEHKDTVSMGTDIAYIQGNGDYFQIMELMSTIDVPFDSILKLSLNEYHSLGEISNQYVEFISALDNYNSTIHSEAFYYNKRANLLNVLSSESLLELQSAKLCNQEQLLNLRKKELERDSSLYYSDAATIQQYDQNKANYYNQIDFIFSSKIEIDKLSDQIEKSKNLINILDAEHKESIIHSIDYAKLQFKLLLNSINSWRNKYVLTAGMDGIVENNYYLQNGQIINSGLEVARIVPKLTAINTQLYFSNINSAQINNGTLVKLYLDDYDKKTEGYLIGHIDEVSNSIIVNSNSEGQYTASISIDFDNQPYFKKEFKFVHGMRGEAVLIIENKPLIYSIINWLNEMSI